MEKKATREFRVNFVDILITVVIAGVITFGAFMIASAFGVETAEKPDYTVLYTLQFRGIEPEYANKIAVGDTVVEAAKRFNLGTVTAVMTEPYVKDVYDEATGTMVAATHPDNITMSVTLAADGYYADGSYYINGSRVAVGVGVSIHAKNFAGTGYVSAMRLK